MWKKDGTLVCNRLPDGRLMPILRMADDAGVKNKQWKQVVKQYAELYLRQNYRGWKPFDGAVKSEFIFWIRRPQAHYRSGRNAHLLKDDAPAEHLYKPDALKLARSTEDALSGVVWVDDCQAKRICSEKRWASKAEESGCSIRVILYPPGVRA